MWSGFLRVAELLQRDGKVEVRVGVAGVQRDSLSIASQRTIEAPEIMLDVSEVEVCFETLGVEADRSFVECLRLDELVARVADVGQVDNRGDQIRIDD